MGKGTKKAVSMKYYYHRLKNDNCNNIYSNLREGAQKSNEFKTFFHSFPYDDVFAILRSTLQKGQVLFKDASRSSLNVRCISDAIRCTQIPSHPLSPHYLLISSVNSSPFLIKHQLRKLSWTKPHVRESLHLRKIIQSSPNFEVVGWFHKGTFHFRFSGIRPLRGGGVPPFSAKEKNLLFFTLIFR